MVKKKIASALMSVCMVFTVSPVGAFADDGGATFKDWKTIYGTELGLDVTSGYDAVTSATNYESSHAQEGSGAVGIPAAVNRVKDAEGKTTALDGANITGETQKELLLLKASHATFEGKAANKTYGTDEFIIEPDYNTEGYTWNDYFDRVYAVTVSDGTTTVGAVPWIDFYGQKSSGGTSGVGHYNYVEVALNSGKVIASDQDEVHRFDAFYDNGELKSGKYDVTVYANGYKPLEAKDIWVPARANAKITIGTATGTSVDLTFDKALPDDFDPSYTVDGQSATYSDGTLTYAAVKPGDHTIKIVSGNVDGDGNKKYGDVSETFTYSIDKDVVSFDGEKLISADASIALADYVNNITNVKVDGVDYNPNAKGNKKVQVIKQDGTIDLSKTTSDETTEAIEVVVTATGYPEFKFTIPAKESNDDNNNTNSNNNNSTNNSGQNNPKTNNGTSSGSAGSRNQVAAKTSISSAVLTIAAQTFNGKALTPAVSVKLGSTVLNKGTDYTVAYSANKNAGTGKVVVTGIGKYEGSKQGTFKINKAKNTLAVKAKTATIKYKAVKKKAQTIKAKKAYTVKKAKGKVTYKKKSGNKKVTVAKNGNIKIKKGLKKGTYKIKVKATASGNANYNALTKTVTVKVKIK